MRGRALKASIIIGGTVSGSFRSAMSSAQSSLKAIGAEISRVEAKQRQLGSAIQTFGRMGKNVDDMRQRYASLTQTVDKLRTAQKRLALASDRVEANRSARAEVGSRIGSSAAAFGALVGAVMLPSKQAAEFNRQNQLIGNTANMTRMQVAELGRTILIASRDANQSAADMQRGIGFLVAAGLDTTRAQASIRTIGRTATASGADIEDLAKASFTLIDSLKIKPDGLQGALDILALAGKEGNVELRDMAKTLPALGSSFVALKMQGREAAATMGAALEIARKGAGDADEAANNMRNFMAKILAPDTLKKARKNFGLDLYGVIQDAQRKGGNPFEAAMQSIMRATAGDQKKIGELFQDMQVQNFLRPMIQNWDEYARIKNKALNGSAGTTDRDFASVMGTAGEKMLALRNSAGRLGITFGTVMAPAVGDAAEKLTHFLDTASGFVEKHPGFVKGVVGSALAMTGLRVAALGVRYAWLTLQAPFLKVGELLARFRAAKAIGDFGRFGAVVGRVGGVVRTVGAVIAGIGGGPIAAAVAAITVGALVVRKYWEPISAWIGGVVEGVGGAFKQAFGELGAALAPLRPAWDAISAAAGQFFGWIGRLLAPVHMTGEELKGATDSGRTFGVVLGAVLTNGIRTITAFVKAVAWIGSAVGNAWSLAKSVVGSAVDWIMGKIAPLVRAGAAVAGAFGFGGATPAPASPTGSTPHPARRTSPIASIPRPPGRVPTGLRAATAAAATGARGGSSPAARAAAPVTVQGDNVAIHVTQQPGESSEALADRIGAVLDRRRETRLRGVLHDSEQVYY